MNTREIMNLALELAGLTEIPADSGIIVEGNNIKKVLAGIDIGTAELLLAKELGVDCVIGHHPIGGTLRTQFTEVIKGQIDRMVEAGVPINKAQKAISGRIKDIDIRISPVNYDRAPSAAKLLNMPYIGIHLPCDKMVEKNIQSHMDKVYNSNPKATIKDLIDELMTIPEYQKCLIKPTARVGAESDYCGKPFVAMAGGTSGGIEVYKAYFEAGVGTLVTMHCPPEDVKKIQDHNIGNMLVAGHMSSDSIGVNTLLKALEDRGVEVIRMSGIISSD